MKSDNVLYGCFIAALVGVAIFVTAGDPVLKLAGLMLAIVAAVGYKVWSRKHPAPGESRETAVLESVRRRGWRPGFWLMLMAVAFGLWYMFKTGNITFEEVEWLKEQWQRLIGR